MSEYANGFSINTRVPEWMYQQIQREGSKLGPDGKEIGMGAVIREALIKSGAVKQREKKKTNR